MKPKISMLNGDCELNSEVMEDDTANDMAFQKPENDISIDDEKLELILFLRYST